MVFSVDSTWFAFLRLIVQENFKAGIGKICSGDLVTWAACVRDFKQFVLSIVSLHCFLQIVFNVIYMQDLI